MCVRTQLQASALAPGGYIYRSASSSFPPAAAAHRHSERVVWCAAQAWSYGIHARRQNDAWLLGRPAVASGPTARARSYSGGLWREPTVAAICDSRSTGRASHIGLLRTRPQKLSLMTGWLRFQRIGRESRGVGFAAGPGGSKGHSRTLAHATIMSRRLRRKSRAGLWPAMLPTSPQPFSSGAGMLGWAQTVCPSGRSTTRR